MLENELRIDELNGDKWVSTTYKFNIQEDMNISEENLNGEACRVSQLLCQYGDAYAKLQAEQYRKEDHLKQLNAKIGLRERLKAQEEGAKLTEAKVAELIITDTAYQAAQASLNWTRFFALRAEKWWRAIQHKTDLIKMLGYRQNTEMKRMI